MKRQPISDQRARLRMLRRDIQPAQPAWVTSRRTWRRIQTALLLVVVAALIALGVIAWWVP